MLTNQSANGHRREEGTQGTRPLTPDTGTLTYAARARAGTSAGVASSHYLDGRGLARLANSVVKGLCNRFQEGKDRPHKHMTHTRRGGGLLALSLEHMQGRI